MNNKYRFYPNPETGCISDENTKSYFSRIGLAVFVLGLAATVVSTALYLLAQSILPLLTTNSAIITAAEHMISFISIYAVGMPLLCLVLKPLPSVSPYKENMPLKDVIGGFCVCILGMLVGNYISNIIIIWLETLLSTATQNPIADAIAPTDGATVLVTVAFMVIIGPILEEILFRKILCSKLLPLGEGYAILISAAIFGLFHGNFYQFAYSFLIGIILSLIYVKTGKLIYTIIYHMGINLLGAVVSPWIVEQIDVEKLAEIVESGVVDPADPIVNSIFLLLAYEAFFIGAAIAGIILLSKAKKKRAITLEKGILPPPKSHRVANIFCNVGVAAAVTYFVLTFFLSLL